MRSPRTRTSKHGCGNVDGPSSTSPVVSENGEMQRDSWYSTARKRARLDAPETIGQTAARRAVRRLGARKVKTIEVPVIFDPENAASLLRAMAGAASGPTLYRRASFLLDRLGLPSCRSGLSSTSTKSSHAPGRGA